MKYWTYEGDLLDEEYAMVDPAASVMLSGIVKLQAIL